MNTLPEIITKLRDRIAINPPEEERFTVLKEYEYEVLVNMVRSYESMLEKAKIELLNAIGKAQSATELTAKIAGDKRMALRERDDARVRLCEALGKLRRCSAEKVAQGERWMYLFK